MAGNKKKYRGIIKRAAPKLECSFTILLKSFISFQLIKADNLIN
jgi:hypothetical protein